MGFFSAVRKIFGASDTAPTGAQAAAAPEHAGGAAADSMGDDELVLALRGAEPKLSAWLDVALQGVSEAGDLLSRAWITVIWRTFVPNSSIAWRWRWTWRMRRMSATACSSS